jgi:hypothetical protein
LNKLNLSILTGLPIGYYYLCSLLLIIDAIHFRENRRPYYDDFDDYEYERRPMRNRNRPESKSNSNVEDERRRHEDRRGGDRRRPAYDEERRPADDRRRNTDRKPQDERRFGNEERKFSDDRQDDRAYARRNPLADDKRIKHQHQSDSKQFTDESISDEKHIKPVGSASIFDRARPPPKISRPVPLSAKNKFAYKSDSKNKDKSEEYEEYDDAPLSSSTTTTQKQVATTTTAASTPKPFSFQKLKPSSSTSKPTTTTAALEAEYYDDEYYDTTVPTQRPIESSSIRTKDERVSLFTSRVRNENVASSTPLVVTTTTAASSPESFRVNRYKNDNSRESVQQSNLQSFIDPATTKKPPSSIISNSNSNNNNGSGNKKYANKQTVFEHVTQETTPSLQKTSTQNHFQSLYNSRNLEKQDIESTSIEEKEQKPAVRVIKRPFLPSRGGNPYKARGLQPVGVLAEQQQNNNQADSPGIDVRQTSNAQKITLEDLYNEEYDVDLNDALNPMLKPLTSSRNVNSFSQSASGDASDKGDRFKTQSQKILHKADHFDSKASTIATTTSTTPQPEYYDDELEYTYADDVA